MPSNPDQALSFAEMKLKFGLPDTEQEANYHLRANPDNSPSCWTANSATVHDKVLADKDCVIRDNSQVLSNKYGSPRIRGGVDICGNAYIEGQVRVSGSDEAKKGNILRIGGNASAVAGDKYFWINMPVPDNAVIGDDSYYRDSNGVIHAPAVVVPAVVVPEVVQSKDGAKRSSLRTMLSGLNLRSLLTRRTAKTTTAGSTVEQAGAAEIE